MAAKTSKSAGKKSSKTMSNAHKAALAEGREQGRAVRAYLEALDAHKPKRGRKRTPDSIKKRLDGVAEELEAAAALDRLHLLQEQADLESELAATSVKVDLSELEAAFIEAAAAYSERKGITYDTWRKMGVQPAVLRAAEVGR
jgi:ATP-dependent exoDNAse (exonuclease V) beta subunit